MIVASWNAKVHRPISDVQAGLKALIKDTHPDVICLQESYEYCAMIRDRFADGWKLYARRGWPESTNCPVMVEANRDPKTYGETWGTLRCYTTWTGRERTHPGRTWTWVKAGGIYIVSLHRCLGGHGPNKQAYLEEAHVLAAFTNEHDKVLILGDANTSHTADHPGSMVKLADRVDGELRYDRKQPGIDYGLQRGIKGTVKRTKEYGSDHKAAIWTERTTTKETPA